MSRLLAVLGLLLAPAAALAQPPASPAEPGNQRARAAFERFAANWMQQVRALEERERTHPTVKPGPSAPIVTYRGYGEDYSVELRPTGHASAPYVGLLRYTELLYACTSVEANECTVASRVPVTEIFRYQDGRWNY